MSFLQPPVLTLGEWLDQMNFSDEPENPNPNMFLDFDVGDTVYVEGDLTTIWYFNESHTALIEVREQESTCVFFTEADFTQYNLNDHLYFEIEIREPGTFKGTSELDHYNPNMTNEEAIVVDIQKEHFSYKLIYLACGFVVISFGLLFTLYTVKFKKERYESNKEKE